MNTISQFNNLQFSALFMAVGEAVGVFRSGHLVACNPAWCAVFGISQDQATGADEGFWHDDLYSWKNWRNEGLPVLAEGRVYESEVPLKRADGTTFSARLRLSHLHLGEPDAGALWCITDLNRQRETEMRLRTSEERFRDLLSLASEWYWEQDRELRFHYVSRSLSHQYSEGANQMMGKRSWEIPYVFGVTSEQWQAHRDMLDARLPFTGFVFKVKTPAGDIRWMSISGKPVFDEHGEFAGYHGVGCDVTERMEGYATPDGAANFDPLTGLPTRRLLIDRIDQATLRAQREHCRAALLLFDLDRFEAINNAHGFAFGDQVLREVTARLRGTIRKYDTLARLGGDKFAVVLPAVGADSDVAAVAVKILDAMREPLITPVGPLAAFGSMGIACIPNDANNVEQLFHAAERALRQAKGAGGATFRFASDAQPVG